MLYFDIRTFWVDRGTIAGSLWGTLDGSLSFLLLRHLILPSEERTSAPSPGVGMGYVEIRSTLITLLHRKYLHPPNEFFPLEVGDGLKLAELAPQFLGRTCQGGLRYEGSWHLLNGFALSHLNNSDHRSGFSYLLTNASGPLIQKKPSSIDFSAVNLDSHILGNEPRSLWHFSLICLTRIYVSIGKD